MIKYGDKVYTRLMDLDIILRDIESMAKVKMFLGTLTNESPPLCKLMSEIDTLIMRLERIIIAVKSNGRLE